MKDYFKNSRVIAKSGDTYLVTFEKNYDINNAFLNVIMIDKNGKLLYGPMPINAFFRDHDWELMDEPYEKVINKPQQDIVKDGLLGFAVGDAFGVPVEFMSRDQVRKVKLNDMVGKDTPNMFNSRWGQTIVSGSYSDDTAMILATMDSMIENNGKINNQSIMNNFLQWIMKGKYSSMDFSFGIGQIILKSLQKYYSGVEPLQCGGKEFMDNGNGSLMRIFPFSIYCIVNNLTEEETVKVISEGSQLTHASDISKMSCFIYTEFLKNIIFTKNPIEAIKSIRNIDYSKYFSKEAINEHKTLLSNGFTYMNDEKIRESGYVVDTLISALYSIIKTKNYEDAIKMAVNLGYDTDTVAGITGSIAGILYGGKAIPERWISKLKKRDYLEDFANRFNSMISEYILKKNDDLEKK